MLRRFGNWEVECDPDDGARLGRLAYRGCALLTSSSQPFGPPAGDLGRYELRPVYGYDDCMPTVSQCPLPSNSEVNVPDHGELCWLPWRVSEGAEWLDCRVNSILLPGISFARRMTFGPRALVWDFTITNDSLRDRQVMHVMHALMPPASIRAITLPEFATMFDEAAMAEAPAVGPAAVASELLELPQGNFRMWLLRGIRQGTFELALVSGPSLNVSFPLHLFGTLAIWWNRRGYPDESHLGRDECALEPCPGASSSLADALKLGPVLNVRASSSLSWQVRWDMNK